MNSSCPAIVEEYYKYTPLQILQSYQLVLSVIAIILVGIAYKFHVRKSWLEGAFKQTLYILLFCIVLHSLLTIVLQSVSLYARLTASTHCGMMFDRRICSLRIALSTIYPSFVCLHTSVTAQRIVTTFSDSRALHRAVALGSLPLTIFFCFGYGFAGYYNYPLSGTTPYCSGIITGDARMVLGVTMCMWGMDISNGVVFFTLRWYNAKKSAALQSSTLPVKFRFHGNVKSINDTLPISIAHLGIMCLQYGLFHFFGKWPLPQVQLAALNGYFYLTPLYCALCPAILLVMERQKRKRDGLLRVKHSVTTETYFNNLGAQWDQHFNERSVGPSKIKKPWTQRMLSLFKRNRRVHASN